MISENALGTIRYTANFILCGIGVVLYIPAMLMALVVSWVQIPLLLQRLWGMVHLQVPLPLENLQVMVCGSLLVAYYGLLSPLVVRLLRKAPFLRPLLLMGVTFHFGLALTYFAMTISFFLGNQSQVVLALIAGTGVVLTRVLLSWLFNRLPAEVLAFQSRYN